MKWSMDTHKFMSEITRKALQIIIKHQVTSSSTQKEIEDAEYELASAGVYKDFKSAKGRIRRALFTYFKSYGCLNDNEQLTEIGKLFVENKITIQEICFSYLLNYTYSDGDKSKYFPVKLLLVFIQKLRSIDENQAYISAYDFSKLVECNSYDGISDVFINDVLEARQNTPITVNERAIGFDIWSNMLIKAGIFKKTTEHTLVVANQELIDWILSAYENDSHCIKGNVASGPLAHFPAPKLFQPNGNIVSFELEGRALQAYLFEPKLTNNVIDKYIFNNSEYTFEDMICALGLQNTKGIYKHFCGLEHLIGYSLSKSHDDNIKAIGEILVSIKLTNSDFTEIMPHDIFIDYDTYERLPGGINVLLYGVPGSGKSWTIEHEYCSDNCVVERLVFHPDYTNSDFIGQILPVVDEDKQVTYEFTPGPFTLMLHDAYVNPMLKYILIIEEINRGNAPAIFGEVFQLLDRTSSTSKDEKWPIGTSEYGITHKYMAEKIYGDSTHKVRIPSNLSIIATMNTSDQNVFTLDTAFQRRWKMRLIENNFDNVRHSLAYAYILDTEITWKKFCETINTIIIGNKTKMASAEDKRLGVYFIHEDDINFDMKALPSDGYETLYAEYNSLLQMEANENITPEAKNRLTEIRNATMHNRIFPEKVIKYLWDDAFKFNPEALFDTSSFESLEQVIRTFVYSSGRDRFKIFRASVFASFYPNYQS